MVQPLDVHALILNEQNAHDFQHFLQIHLYDYYIMEIRIGIINKNAHHEFLPHQIQQFEHDELLEHIFQRFLKSLLC